MHHASLSEIDAIGNFRSCQLSCVGPYASKVISKFDSSCDLSKLEPLELVKECMRILSTSFMQDEEGDISDKKIVYGKDVEIGIIGEGIPFFVLDDINTIKVVDDRNFASLQLQKLIKA